jgi:hypothetical protein
VLLPTAQQFGPTSNFDWVSVENAAVSKIAWVENSMIGGRRRTCPNFIPDPQ